MEENKENQRDENCGLTCKACKKMFQCPIVILPCCNEAICLSDLKQDETKCMFCKKPIPKPDTLVRNKYVERDVERINKMNENLSSIEAQLKNKRTMKNKCGQICRQ